MGHYELLRNVLYEHGMEKIAAAKSKDIFRTDDILPSSSRKHASGSTSEMIDMKGKNSAAMGEPEKHKLTEDDADFDVRDIMIESSSLKDGIKEVKQLIKTMVLGLKTVVWCVSNYNHTNKKKSTQVKGKRQKMSEKELRMILRFCESALHCFRVYSKQNARLSEKKEVLDHFAAVFTVLDPAAFQDVFQAQIGMMYDYLMKEEAMITIPQHLLSNQNTSRIFADILLKFLVKRIPDLSIVESDSLKLLLLQSNENKNQDEKKLDEKEKLKKLRRKHSERTSTLLRLFKLVFHSIVLFADNELVLQPYLAIIVKTGIKNAMKVRRPDNFLLLIRALFRRVAAGKFELLYKEFVPLLPGMFSCLVICL
jgi:transformation/transcription domain-associated protein